MEVGHHIGAVVGREMESGKEAGRIVDAGAGHIADVEAGRTVVVVDIGHEEERRSPEAAGCGTAEEEGYRTGYVAADRTAVEEDIGLDLDCSRRGLGCSYHRLRSSLCSPLWKVRLGRTKGKMRNEKMGIGKKDAK